MSGYSVALTGARDGKPFTIQLQPYASTDSLPKAYTWSVAWTVSALFSHIGNHGEMGGSRGGCPLQFCSLPPPQKYPNKRHFNSCYSKKIKGSRFCGTRCRLLLLFTIYYLLTLHLGGGIVYSGWRVGIDQRS